MAGKRKPTGSVDTTVVGTKAGKLITPEQIAASGTEHGHQAAFFQWIVLEGRKLFGTDADLLFAVPNGGDRRASVAASMKAEGVKPGVPDVCWPLPRSTGGTETHLSVDGGACSAYAGLWLELKKPTEVGKKNGGRSDAQVEWHKRLRAQGYAVVLAFGWQAMAWAAYLYWKGELVTPPGDDALWAMETSAPPVVET